MATNRVEHSTLRPQQAQRVCNLCGNPSDRTICDNCSEKLRLDALIRKKHEEQGSAWSHWE